ncbi:hypothetical protein FDJ09_gp60 [Escherichia phage VB_EcoS-Golestan]|uniref:Uncharacterized protein n=1 Tax=Escherichia phage VB_EcoS-Golestan TaxID=2047801 RepID=A0A2D2W544_9CAUD|nr:hypothetical protein FDJ09_gp60 [Escherichia phage VB_EcoS-Golestan]ATS93284.1 hypothetical protein E1_60 [Escherichia phage VB_EcoS-Golestan]UOL50950.1 hypothetical protein [Escherichia phage vB_EcoS_SCS44]
MDSKNEVFEYLIDQLRQQVNNNQCEDLAQEVQSLKNRLRDASAQIKELHKELEYIGGEYRRALDYDLSDAPKQSGCRKGYTQKSCWIEWSGGACPVPRGTLVDVIYRDGETLCGLPADELNDTERDASVCFWRHNGMSNDIVRYRKAVRQ